MRSSVFDPFDQPDVEASKDRTRALTEAYEKSQSLPDEEALFRENGLALYADPRNAAALGRHNTLTGYLKGHFTQVHTGDYVAPARLHRAQRVTHADVDLYAHAHP